MDNDELEFKKILFHLFHYYQTLNLCILNLQISYINSYYSYEDYKRKKTLLLNKKQEIKDAYKEKYQEYKEFQDLQIKENEEKN